MSAVAGKNTILMQDIEFNDDNLLINSGMTETSSLLTESGEPKERKVVAPATLARACCVLIPLFAITVIGICLDVYAERAKMDCQGLDGENVKDCMNTIMGGHFMAIKVAAIGMAISGCIPLALWFLKGCLESCLQQEIQKKFFLRGSNV
ncbi:hypothetical protein QS306_01390 [Paraburkholderia bonniea]|uniref:hypothetical protein n=1 Tax=Paraburkholderia bonniea TaxID=2152891 RepID=UPI00257269D9|nr:hypothetical protein [Paraburkholderia bonniea]WJF90368.1 hypothetical protein QS306_01390 [Paraburkholderia bonniea]WJF93683.1 hypothetical protein QS308_01390 [Paraburkholderia bonniea]